MPFGDLSLGVGPLSALPRAEQFDASRGCSQSGTSPSPQCHIAPRIMTLRASNCCTGVAKAECWIWYATSNRLDQNAVSAGKTSHVVGPLGRRDACELERLRYATRRE
jgi:hypothetical protein